MPANVVPGSPLAEVVKMLQAGVDASTIKAYIANSQSAFNLDADTILFLTDLGAPSDLINAMMACDKALYASSVAPPPPPPPPPTPLPVADTNTSVPPDAANPPDAASQTELPPSPDMTQDYFNDTLAPYGSWVDVAGYGACWRPAAEIYDPNWSPYCDRGHWVYTDYGWYWDSDYAWGLTFHYGRWFNTPALGWCWYPDTVWAPSWVVWRAGDDYLGWAPLPPFAVFQQGVGFLYRGVPVGPDFGFGLAANSFVFVSPEHFSDRQPRSVRLAQPYVAQVFRQTTIVANYSVNNHFLVNRGFGAERIASATHRVIEPVQVSSLANAGRQGWRGEGFQRTLYPPGSNNRLSQYPRAQFQNTAPGSGSRAQPQPFIRQQPQAPLQPQLPARQSYPVSQPGKLGTQNQWPQSPPNQWPQTRGFGTAANDGVQPRGAIQPPPPRPDERANYVQGQARGYSPPPPAAPPVQPQPQNPGNVPAAPANNGNNSSNKQNH